ncbi:MAG: hypothetical protein V1867_02985 [Candidatus Falkowbacteria bacterium]
MTRKTKPKNPGTQSIKIQLVLSREYEEMLSAAGGTERVFQAVVREIREKTSLEVRLLPKRRWSEDGEQVDAEPAIGF